MTTSRTAKVTLPTDEQILISASSTPPGTWSYKAWTTPDWSGAGGAATRRDDAVEIAFAFGGRWGT